MNVKKMGKRRREEQKEDEEEKEEETEIQTVLIPFRPVSLRKVFGLS